MEVRVEKKKGQKNLNKPKVNNPKMLIIVPCWLTNVKN
jgi:hypothetical protein